MQYVGNHAQMAATETLALRITRKNTELIAPAESTPYEFKSLSDIDDQRSLRGHIPFINFYRKNPSMNGKDPVNVIRNAIAKALVFYYPLAGRLREYTGGKLVVECTGEGVVFVEADADVTLQHFGDDALYPPFPNSGELLDIQGFDEIINNPLVLFQVTRLKCGGFILAYIFNHTICDGAGVYQFMYAVGELARGGATPSITPVWQRHLLTARQPPRPSFTHREYDVVLEPDVNNISSSGKDNELVQRSFFFRAADISALRRTLPPHLQSCSEFEVVAGCVWRCRTIALSPKPDDEIRLLCAVDTRKRMDPPLPVGYYGNAVALPAAVTTAGELSKSPLAYAVELVRKARSEARGEYLRSVADLMVMRDRRPRWTAAGAYLVSDVTRGNFERVDVGWGPAVYGGVAKGIHHNCIPAINWYIPFKNKLGEGGVMVPICLPLNAIKVFVKQIQLTMTASPTTSAL